MNELNGEQRTQLQTAWSRIEDSFRQDARPHLAMLEMAKLLLEYLPPMTDAELTKESQVEIHVCAKHAADHLQRVVELKAARLKEEAQVEAGKDTDPLRRLLEKLELLCGTPTGWMIQIADTAKRCEATLKQWSETLAKIDPLCEAIEGIEARIRTPGSAAEPGTDSSARSSGFLGIRVRYADGPPEEFRLFEISPRPGERQDYDFDRSLPFLLMGPQRVGVEWYYTTGETADFGGLESQLQELRNAGMPAHRWRIAFKRTADGRFWIGLRNRRGQIKEWPLTIPAPATTKAAEPTEDRNVGTAASATPAAAGEGPMSARAEGIDAAVKLAPTGKETENEPVAGSDGDTA